VTKKHQILSPFDQSVIGTVTVSDLDDVAGSVRRATEAFPAWSSISVGERCDLLEQAGNLIAGKAEQIARLLSSESGKVLGQAEFEVQLAVALLKANAERARYSTGILLPTESLANTANDIAWSRRVPLGTIAALLPFNFPVELLIEKVTAALAVGNTVVLKPPEQDPLAVLSVVECFHEAGIPREVLEVVIGDAKVGGKLISADGIAAISLTGSTRAGVAVAETVAAKLRRLHLELGGNDAAIILEDADLDLVLKEIVAGRILMNGQSCAANKRLVVHRKIAAELTERLVNRVRELKVGNPLDPNSDLGPLITESAAEHVIVQVERAVQEGARLVAGDGTTQHAMVQPHVLADVPRTAQVANDDEIFGPVFTVIPVASEREALLVANQSSFGLNGAVFSRDISRALALSERLQTGGVVINGSGNYRPLFVPFGGVKLSGLGREGLGFTMEEMTQPKFTVLRGIRRAASTTGLT
jgi:acyl-CoA reductase-like NAD-dependent aldehyde dehydrogenase